MTPIAAAPIAAAKAALDSWLDAERDRLAVWLPVFMGVGVLTYYALRFEPAPWLGAAFAAPTLAIAVALPGLRWAFGPIAAVAIGFTAGQLATARAPPIEADLPTHATIVTGTIQAVEALPLGRRITIQPAWLDGAAEPLRRSVRLRLQNKDDGDLGTGDTVRIRALVRPPSPPSYPGAWDLQRDAFYAGLGASGYALGKAERTAQSVPSGPMRFVQRLREIIRARVVAVIPGAAGAVSVTLLTGASMAIPEADHAAFRDSGLAHLLAVAGLHIGIVMGFALALSRFGLALSERASLFWPTKQLAALCALAAGAAYMVLTGMHLPIIRSFVMACLFTVALMANRRPFSLRGLGLAAAVLMLISPQQVPNVSFQMSFSAVLALIAGYEALRPWLRRLHGHDWRRRLGSHLVALALTSALAGTASAPYGAYHFGHVQVYFVLANMIAVPLTAMWVMPAGLIALLLMPLHLEAIALLPMGWGAQAILWVARATAALPAATIQVPHIPAWGLGLFSIGLAWLGLWQTRRRLAGVVVMAAGLASPLLDRPPDLLISSDARLIAVRTPQGAFLQQTQGGSKFTRDAWEQYWGIGSFQPIPGAPAPKPRSRRSSRSRTADAATTAPPTPTTADVATTAPPTPTQVADGAIVQCEPGACLLRPYLDRPGVLLAQGADHPTFCGQSSVIVSAEPARGLCPRPWPGLVDRFTVWRYGSAAIWLNHAGARVLTDRTERGDRPWVPPPPQPRKAAAPVLPPAVVDRADPPGANGIVSAEAVSGEPP
ncbi:ComEC/Rec2 family competence protein [Rhodopila sp.]|uniref:ComEC/Rec2 family competence protein n=1 Tax=Rhodopila sp. TaxID=2480087 RepID=UPI003D0CE907